MRTKKLPFFALTALLLIISLACDISFGDKGLSEDEISLELTRMAIVRMQTEAAAPDTSDADSDASDSESEESEDMDEDESSDEVEEEEDSEDTCNVSKFVSETIPDGSVFDPGDIFTKKWVVRNNGTCDWTTGYRFVFEQGDRMGGATSMNLTRTVEPGETYTFEVDLTAPAADGEYTGRWRIKSDDGENLGFYYTQIIVGAGSAGFAVTSVPLTLSHTSPISIVCPGNTVVTIRAAITTSAGGVVSFKWDDSQGCSGCATKSTTFAGAETKNIDHTMTVGAAGNYWAKIYIDTPNHQWFGPISFDVVCTP